MAVRNPPAWLQTGSHTAENDRLFIQSLTGAGGVTDGLALKVSPNSPAGMSVLVGAGGAFIPGTNQANQGTYHVWNDANVTVGISAADPALPRKDIVIAKVQDSSVSGAVDLASVTAITGTPSSSPVVPVSPPNSIILAVVNVTASSSGITVGNIVDSRPFAAAPGGIASVTSTTRPAHQAGRAIYEADTQSIQVSNGTTWNEVWSSSTQTSWLTTGITAATGWSITTQRYRKTGQLVEFNLTGTYTGANFAIPAGGNITNKTIATLPSGFRPSVVVSVGRVYPGLMSGILANFQLATNGELDVVALASSNPSPVSSGDVYVVTGVFLI